MLGASFGGMVAISYATRHPEHPSKLVLISTEAAGGSHRDRRVALFERFGGAEVGALARRRFLEEEGHPDLASIDAWRRLAMPHYTRIPRDPDMAHRAVNRFEVLQWFTRPGGESRSFNMLGDLHRIQCRTLVLGGEDDLSTRSRVRRIPQRRCPLTSCNSSGLRIAGMPWSRMRLSAPWPLSATLLYRAPLKQTGARRRR